MGRPGLVETSQRGDRGWEKHHIWETGARRNITEGRPGLGETSHRERWARRNITEGRPGLGETSQRLDRG